MRRSDTYLEFIEATLFEVLCLEHVFLAVRPLFVNVALVLELLRQVIQTLQTKTPQRRGCRQHKHFTLIEEAMGGILPLQF